MSGTADLLAPDRGPTWQPGDVEPVTCPVCGSDDGRSVIRRPDGLVVEDCPGCGTAYVNPRPRAALVDRLYDLDYFTDAHTGDVGYENYLADDWASRVVRRRVNRERRRVVERYRPLRGVRLLEVGCAAGDFAAEAVRAGASVTAADIVPEVIERAGVRHPGIRFAVASAEDLARDDERYDIVVAFEVIEHVVDPVTFMTSLRTLVAPGGLVVLSTPDWGYGRAIGAERWTGFRMSLEHLSFFTVRSLEILGQRVDLTLHDWLGAGDGRWALPSDPQGLRRVVRDALAATRLLPAARAVRTLARPQPAYRTRESGHNLIVVFDA
jgi:2-polyprenyl-3-methyl-5-hydroxy-6-metoxy-1,4-benzoquinol methylase